MLANNIPEHSQWKNVWGKHFFLVLVFLGCPEQNLGKVSRCSKLLNSYMYALGRPGGYGGDSGTNSQRDVCKIPPSGRAPQQPQKRLVKTVLNGHVQNLAVLAASYMYMYIVHVY